MPINLNTGVNACIILAPVKIIVLVASINPSLSFAPKSDTSSKFSSINLLNSLSPVFTKSKKKPACAVSNLNLKVYLLT